MTSSEPGEAEIELYGIMCDGTVVMGTLELDGTAAPVGALDAQGGHTHDIVGTDGTLLLSNRYHVHIRNGGGAHIDRHTPEVRRYLDCDVEAGATADPGEADLECLRCAP